MHQGDGRFYLPSSALDLTTDFLERSTIEQADAYWPTTPAIADSLRAAGWALPRDTAVRPEILLNLWDPFNFMARMTPEPKQAGLVKEINNGRLAMLGIFSLISEARVPGSVPVLPNEIPEYAGKVMLPFSRDFSLFN